jgi:protein disulfide-isomerase A6
MAGIFTFAAVDCDKAGNRGLCAEFEIQGFPTLKFMGRRNGKLDVQDYTAPRTAKGLTDFAKERMENLVVRVTDDSIKTFLADKVLGQDG